MNSTMKTARVAGLLYLLIVLTGLFNLQYTPAKLIVKGNAAETASNILAHQTLFRVDIAVGLISIIIFMFLAFSLYRLLKDVNNWQATLMVILVLVQIPQAFVSELLQLGALTIVSGSDFLSVFDKPQRDALAMLCLHLNDLGTHISEMFWGLWLLPLGVLVFRSGFIPRFLGVWLIINCFAYVVLSLTGLLLPQYVATVSMITIPALLGELAFMFWLLIMGARPRLLSSRT